MKNTKINAAHNMAGKMGRFVAEFSINFTDRERYKRAVRAVMRSDTLRLVRNGRYLSGPEYGYVSFTRINKTEGRP